MMKSPMIQGNPSKKASLSLTGHKWTTFGSNDVINLKHQLAKTSKCKQMQANASKCKQIQAKRSKEKNIEYIGTYKQRQKETD